MFQAVPERGVGTGMTALSQLHGSTALTSAISIFPSEFLSYFCMNSFIFSPKLSLFDICGQRKEADLAARLCGGEAVREAGLGVISHPGHVVQEPEALELRGPVSALDLSHMIIKGDRTHGHVLYHVIRCTL